MPESRIMHIEHASNNDYTAIAHTSDGMYLYQFTSGKDTIILDSNTESGTSNIEFFNPSSIK